MLLEAKAAGECLLEVKAQCPHGTFKQWVEANTSVDIRMAQKYMRVAKLANTNRSSLLEHDSINAFLDAHAQKKEQPTASHSLPEFTKDDAEYAQKIMGRMQSDFEGEREAAKRKLETFAESFGMTTEEVQAKSEELNPNKTINPVEDAMEEYVQDIMKPYMKMTRDELLHVILEMILKQGA
jgi:hypothetical protein